MVERISKKYRLLFELRLLHHYWLDEGDKTFDSLSEKSKEARLHSYNMQAFLKITPTVKTTMLLRGVGGIYKDTALGCVVAVPDNEVLLPETTLEFLVTVKDAAFFNYTALTLIPRKIYEFILQSKDPDSDDRPPIIKAYRYKENVPVLSNLTGASRGIGQNRSLFLSQKFPALQENDLVEFLVLSDNGLLQLTSDQPGAETQQLAKADDLPIYIHQADVPPIVPPAGLTGVPTKGLKLDDDIPDDVFVFIQLSAVRNDDDDYSFINKDTGQAKEEKSHPVFQVRFKNRSTIWQYLNKNDKSLNSEEPNPLPFTYFGNISSTKGKPSEGSVKALKTDPSNKTRITKLVSEIFI